MFEISVDVHSGEDGEHVKMLIGCLVEIVLNTNKAVCS